MTDTRAQKIAGKLTRFSRWRALIAFMLFRLIAPREVYETVKWAIDLVHDVAHHPALRARSEGEG